MAALFKLPKRIFHGSDISSAIEVRVKCLTIFAQLFCDQCVGVRSFRLIFHGIFAYPSLFGRWIIRVSMQL